jgi:HicB family
VAADRIREAGAFDGANVVSTKTYPLKLPASLKAAAARLAKADGVSLNQWIATAVAQKVGVVETACDFLLHRSGTATGEGMAALLALVPSTELSEEDRLPIELGDRQMRTVKRRRR